MQQVAAGEPHLLQILPFIQASAWSRHPQEIRPTGCKRTAGLPGNLCWHINNVSIRWVVAQMQREASFYPEEGQSVTFFCEGLMERISTQRKDGREQRRNDRSEPHRPVEPWMKSPPTGRSASLVDDRWRNDVGASGLTWKHHDFVRYFQMMWCFMCFA